jgi:lysozyme
MNVVFRRLLAIATGAALLAACSGVADSPIASSLRGYAPVGANPYPDKSDADFHDGVARAHGKPVQGIDVSRWQGDIDWHRVRASGTRFAFIKATEGGDHLDPKFRENWQGAKRAGVPRGAYHFVYWCRPAHEQILWFILNVPADPDALPPVLDVEWNHQSRSCPGKIPAERARQKMRVMLDGMEAHTGKRPIIYTDITFHRDVLEGHFNDYPFWLRSVAAEPHERYADRPWMLWQFTATGRVPGVKGDVDRNAFKGSEADWERLMRAWTGNSARQVAGGS